MRLHVAASCSAVFLTKGGFIDCGGGRRTKAVSCSLEKELRAQKEEMAFHKPYLPVGERDDVITQSRVIKFFE